MEDSARMRAFYVSPNIMRDFADTISRNKQCFNRIIGATSNGLMIVMVAYDVNDGSINDFLQLNCHYTRELDRVEAYNYNFSVPLMEN